MAKSRVTINEQALAKIGQDIAKRVEGVIAEVAAEMKGGDAAAINAELTRHLRAINVEPNAARVLELAEQIAGEDPAS